MASGTIDVHKALKRYFGHDAFRPHQEEIVKAILSCGDVFVALPTGGGKSLCYQLPALLSSGLTVVVSPLIALMKDQVDGAQRLGIPATFLNSSLSPAESRERWHAVAAGQTRLLYVSPERLANESFRGALGRLGLSFIAVDEAHCISEWGHEFRPDYRSLRVLRQEFPDLPIAAFTATATRRVQKDIVTLLGLKQPLVVRASFNRPEIFYRVVEKGDVQRQIAEFVAARAGAPGIVYRATRRDTELTARELAVRGVPALAYHAGMSDEERRRTQERFLADEAQVVVATIAFGLGIDKPNVRWIVHGDLPRSIEGYYQETGRAARDGMPAESVLFYGRQDIAKIRWHIGNIESARERGRAEERLRAMTAYVESSRCRRSILLEHFDEKHEGNCGACDVCAGELATEDLTEAARMILSAAVRTGERFGAHHLADIVTGNASDKVLERSHNLLPTFGVGKGRDRSFWLSLARELEEGGHLERGEGEKAGFRLTPQGRLLLSGKLRFVGRRRGDYAELPAGTSGAKTRAEGRAPRGIGARKARRSAAERLTEGARASAAGSRTRGAGQEGADSAARQEIPESLEGATAELFACLKEGRKREAARAGLPAFVLFSDKSLRAIAAARPRTREELLSCYGIGERKAELYGEMVLRIVRSFIEGGGCRGG